MSPTALPTVVLHVDMDAYFASIQQRDNPALRGQPVIVGGRSSSRGVVASASYEARAYGVRAAMPTAQALARCPGAIVLPCDMSRYRAVTQQLEGIWQRWSPKVEVASLDEAYLDLTGCERLLGTTDRIAQALQAEIRAETGLTCSIGVGSSKLVAKLASQRHKPRGICLVPAGDERAWLAGFAVGDVPGIGPKTAERLQQIGIHHVRDLQRQSEDQLVQRLGPAAHGLVQLAHGIDPRPVCPDRPVKSIGAEATFATDLRDRQALKAILLDQVQEVAFRLRRQGRPAKTVAIKVRYADFETITRARTLAVATDDDQVIATTALALFRQHASPGRAIRLLGVTVSQFTDHAQLSLLDGADHAARHQLHQTLDGLRHRFGLWSVSRATHLLGRSQI